MDIVIASNNKHKVAEISEILKGKFDNIYTLNDLNIDVDVEETGKTFMENAVIKARAISRLSGMAALGDDSGLEVDALNGAPGVYSARYSGVHGDDNANNALLLKNLSGITNRHANFTCAIAVCYPDGTIVAAEGKSYGRILEEPKGEGGFGYDPLFQSNEFGATYAELTQEQKNLVSHRGRALKELQKKL